MAPRTTVCNLLTCQIQVQNVTSVEPVLVLDGLLKVRLKVEHDCFKMTDTVLAFCKIWTAERVLGSVAGAEKVLNF